MNPNSELFGWAILVATCLGPIAAVLVTRYNDARRAKHERQMSVFRTLMATRATDLNSERVAALNLIQIEFANNPDVLQAWSGLLQHFGGPDATTEEEAKRFGRERTRLTTVLLDKMARRLGIRVEQLDILEGVYHPRGFWQIEQEQQALRRLLLEIAGPTGYHGRACAARDGRAAARRQYLAMVPRSIGTPNNEKPRP